MAKANIRREDKGPGAEVINQQRTVDDAKKEHVKQQYGEDADVNALKNRDRNHDKDISRKKSDQ